MDKPNLIDSLGGSGVVAGELSLKTNRVSMWRDRGVPWRWRPRIAELAREKGVQIPADFLAPEMAA